MIDQGRVREMTKLAAYEQHEKKGISDCTSFYRSDFVGRHLIKGFFCATISYGLILLLWGAYHFEELLANLDTMDLVQFAIAVLVRYLLFLGIYLLALAIYANLSYAAGRKSSKRYYRSLKRLSRLYEEQEARTAPNQHGRKA